MKKLIILILTAIISVSAAFKHKENPRYFNGEWYQCEDLFYDENGSIEKKITSDSAVYSYENFYHNGILIKSKKKEVDGYYSPSEGEIRFNSCGDTVYSVFKSRRFETEDIIVYKYKDKHSCKIERKEVHSTSEWKDRNETKSNTLIYKYEYSKNKVKIKEYYYTIKDGEEAQYENILYYNKEGDLIKKEVYDLSSENYHDWISTDTFTINNTLDGKITTSEYKAWNDSHSILEYVEIEGEYKKSKCSRLIEADYKH